MTLTQVGRDGIAFELVPQQFQGVGFGGAPAFVQADDLGVGQYDLGLVTAAVVLAVDHVGRERRRGRR
ncbi:hypothetical protein [Sphaerisporangium album]|uniref:hypothetical protein n=1 Tax=Sphaerisporangium album TaxID=509200 RepID=UPI0015F09B8C|nr:hypothetical protein [Sphaerisporangium album]